MTITARSAPIPHSSSATALAGLLVVLYFPLLLHWYDGWLNKSIGLEHEYFSHGVIGLPIAAYLAWKQRTRWRRLRQGHWGGLALLALGLIGYSSGVPDGVNLSLLAVLTGLCLWLKGKAGLRLMTMPLVLVALATPTPLPSLIAPYTLPLQQLIAGLSGFLLMQTGLQVQVDGIYIFVNQRLVEIAPHCAGLKLLFTSLYVGLILATWQEFWPSGSRVRLFFSGIVAVSVVANVLRNTALSFLHGIHQTGLFDWLHEGWGGDLYSALTLAGIVGLSLAIARLPKSSALSTVSFH